MWKAFFGELGGGRLTRLQYLGYSVLLNLILFAIVIGVTLLAGGLEQAGDDPAAMQRQLLERFGAVGMSLMTVLFFLLLFAGLNLMAKRLRDMGLPGWPGVLGVMIVSLILAMAFGGGAPAGGAMPPAMSLIQLAILAFLLLVPGNAFGGGRPKDGPGDGSRPGDGQRLG